MDGYGAAGLGLGAAFAGSAAVTATGLGGAMYWMVKEEHQVREHDRLIKSFVDDAAPTTGLSAGAAEVHARQLMRDADAVKLIGQSAMPLDREFAAVVSPVAKEWNELPVEAARRAGVEAGMPLMDKSFQFGKLGFKGAAGLAASAVGLVALKAVDDSRSQA